MVVGNDERTIESGFFGPVGQDCPGHVAGTGTQARQEPIRDRLAWAAQSPHSGPQDKASRGEWEQNIVPSSRSFEATKER
jgi:hypothetical protein